MRVDDPCGVKVFEPALTNEGLTPLATIGDPSGVIK
jgi:hypothetical protein